MNILTKFKHQQDGDDLLISNLHQKMQEKGISEAELSRQTYIPQPTLHKILSGKTGDPRISTLKALADYFDTTLDALYSNTVTHQTSPTPQGQFAPILSWEDCIQISANRFQQVTGKQNYWVNTNNSADEILFALVSKPCMEPRFPRGTILIISSDRTPNDGDMVIVHYPNTQAATIRELYLDGPEQKLVSINKASYEEKLTPDIKILGTLIQSRFDYDGSLPNQ